MSALRLTFLAILLCGFDGAQLAPVTTPAPETPKDWKVINHESIRTAGRTAWGAAGSQVSPVIVACAVVLYFHGSDQRGDLPDHVDEVVWYSSATSYHVELAVGQDGVALKT